MKLAFSTNAFKKTDVYAALDAIAQAGYVGVELLADQPHAFPATFAADARARLRQHARALSLGWANINAFTGFGFRDSTRRGNTYDPTWISASESDRAWRIEHTRQCIALAAELGISTISLQPGGPTERIDRQIALARFAEGLREVLPAADAAGVTLGIEPEPGLAIESWRELLTFFQHISHPRLKMNCDLGHHFCVGEDPAQVIRDARDMICHVHLEDISADRVHQHLLPGDGAMNFPAIFAALEHVNYAGFVTVELYPFVNTAAEVAKIALDRLRGMGVIKH